MDRRILKENAFRGASRRSNIPVATFADLVNDAFEDLISTRDMSILGMVDSVVEDEAPLSVRGKLVSFRVLFFLFSRMKNSLSCHHSIFYSYLVKKNALRSERTKRRIRVKFAQNLHVISHEVFGSEVHKPSF